MPLPRAQLAIPQPCPESWEAMTPASGGRHCVACQQVVVDFTRHTDAELLAYFRQARPGQTCGRFRTEQVDRPLQPTAPATTSRWRAAVALALAAWGATQAEAAPRPVPAGMHHAPRRPSARPARRSTRLPARFVQGTVRDAVSGQPLVGVAVFLRGENRQAVTDSNGWFGLRLSPRRPRGGRALVLHYTDYRSETVRLAATRQPITRLALALEADAVAAAGAQVVGYQVQNRSYYTSGAVSTVTALEITVPQPKPWPWHPRSFYYWSKYWITRPFRHTPKTSDL